MANRAIKVRIECDKSNLAHLWRTHVVFNKHLPTILSQLTKMRKGKSGDSPEARKLYQRIAQFIILSGSQKADYLMNALSIEGWKPNAAKKYKVKTSNGEEITGEAWADQAAELSAKGNLLYKKNEMFKGLPGTITQQLLMHSVAILSGHDELVKLWENEHTKWLLEKVEWEEKETNKKYLALRPQFEKFESEEGHVGKRRGRWHLYIEWLQNNPDLASWRGGEPVINKFSDKGQKRIDKSPAWKKAEVIKEEFFKSNPELEALDRLHGAYERKFVRRRKTKKNFDGFDHRPTFTMPDPNKHPRWLDFNAPQTQPTGYKNLLLPGKDNAYGEIDLNLLTGDDTGEGFPSNWIKLKFKSDPRLLDFQKTVITTEFKKGANKGKGKEKAGYLYNDRQLNEIREAQICGAKLVFKNIKLDSDQQLKSATPYLVFRCETKSPRWTDIAKKVKLGKKGKVPDELTACAVDLGVRNLGFATIAKVDKGLPVLLRSQNLWVGHEELEGRHQGRWQKGPLLSHLAKNKRKLVKLRRQRGKPVKGEFSHKEYQDHVTNIGEDRFKKGARKIINFALNVNREKNKAGVVYPKADVLLIESLEGLIPDAERTRGINKALVSFNRGHLVEHIKHMAEECGLRYIEVYPIGTSQVCSRCGSLGRRYSIQKVDGVPSIKFGFVEKLFSCPHCNYRSNSDHNASVNLHRRFVLGDSAVKSFQDYQALKEKEKKREVVDGIEKELEPSLKKVHGLD